MLNSKSLNALDSGVENDEQSAELLRGGGDVDIMSETPKNNEAYVLYNALRSTQENTKLDEKSQRKLEGAKQVLKQSLIARCGQKNTCQRKCQQKKKPSGCQSNCQKIFDELDAYDDEKPKKCKKNDECGGSGRGKTMPPYWLRSLLGI